MNSLKKILRKSTTTGKNIVLLEAGRYAARGSFRARRHRPAGLSALPGILNTFPPARGPKLSRFDDSRYPVGQHRPRQGRSIDQEGCFTPAIISLAKATIQAAQNPSWPARGGKGETAARNFRSLQNRGSIYVLRREEIQSYRQLPHGWNSYDAEAPGPEAVALALCFVDLLEKHAVKIEWVAPSVDDSVMMTVDVPSGKQEWEFFGDGTTAVMHRDAEGAKSYVDLEVSNFERFLMR